MVKMNMITRHCFFEKTQGYMKEFGSIIGKGSQDHEGVGMPQGCQQLQVGKI